MRIHFHRWNEFPPPPPTFVINYSCLYSIWQSMYANALDRRKEGRKDAVPITARNGL